MRIYLDNCCFNRPFDDQSQLRIRLESEAKLDIQQRIKDGRLELAWSYVLDYENQANPFAERREVIARWKTKAIVDTKESAAILHQASRFVVQGLHAKDALHIACAMATGCDYFLTTDDIVGKKMREFSDIIVLNPTQFIVEASQ
jgi:hypothetical protein